MRYESKFKRFIRGMGLYVGILLMIGGSFLTFLPFPQVSASVGTFITDADKDIYYNDEIIIVPDFIPYTKITAYLKYSLYTPQHIKFTSYYCPEAVNTSHKDDYCAYCNPSAVLQRYHEGLHAPDFFRNTFKSVRIESEDGKTVIYQQVR